MLIFSCRWWIYSEVSNEDYQGLIDFDILAIFSACWCRISMVGDGVHLLSLWVTKARQNNFLYTYLIFLAFQNMWPIIILINNRLRRPCYDIRISITIRWLVCLLTINIVQKLMQDKAIYYSPMGETTWFKTYIKTKTNGENTVRHGTLRHCKRVAKTNKQR